MRQGDVLTLAVDSINSEGEGIARHGADNFVVFIPNALPGERVECRIVKVGKRYATAKAFDIVEQSGVRVRPKCPSYLKCGGCQLQHASYRAQLGIKSKILSDAMRRIAGIDLPKGMECVPSPSEWGYRNKTVLPVSQTRRGPLFGYYERRSHDIVPFTACPVLMPQIETLLPVVIDSLSHSGFKGYDESSAEGDIRYVAARCAAGSAGEEALLGLVVARKLKKREVGRLRDICQRMGSLGPKGSLAGSALNLNSAPGNFIWGPQFKSLFGKKTIRHTLNGIDFDTDISTFFQINAPQAETMFAYAGGLVKDASPSSVLELYSGVGSLTAHLASVAERVEAVEDWRPSVRMLLENMALNGIDNITVNEESSEDFMRAHAKRGLYDAVVLDPPRTGCHESVIEGIREISPKIVVYVSCNPATLARDVARLVEGGDFNLESVKAFDMFPQTAHVESVALLRARRMD